MSLLCNIWSRNSVLKVFLLRFDAARLDVWWTCNLEFKVYLRSLNQRTPTLVGTATIGLKHVLMDGDFYKEVDEPPKEVKLPVYGSTGVCLVDLQAKRGKTLVPNFAARWRHHDRIAMFCFQPFVTGLMSMIRFLV